MRQAGRSSSSRPPSPRRGSTPHSPHCHTVLPARVSADHAVMGGKFRKIGVKVKRGQCTIRSRPGYVAEAR
jgi:hypothetical protein